MTLLDDQRWRGKGKQLSTSSAAALDGRGVATWVAALILGLLSGSLVTDHLLLASAVALSCALMGLLALFARASVPVAWITVFVLGSSLVSLPRLIAVGPVTGLGVVTIAATITGVAGLATQPGWIAVVPRPLLAYVLLLLVGLIIRPPSMAGAVSVLTSVVFVAALCFGSAMALCDRRQRGIQTLLVASTIAVAIGYVTVSLASAVTANTSGDGVFSARPYAMFGVLALALALASTGRTTVWVLGLSAVGFGIYSLSRSDLAAMAAMLIIGRRPLSGIGPWMKAAVRIAAIFAVGYALIHYYAPLHDRFYRGDIVRVGGVRVNAEGRTSLWGATWHRFLESPVVGHGAGDADATATRVDPRAGHPHNDYLRLLDDTGIVGFSLWLWGYASIGRRLVGNARSRARAGEVAWAAFLAWLGVAIVMMFDNPMIYLFIMIPLGVLFGLGMTTESRGEAALSGRNASALSDAQS